MTSAKKMRSGLYLQQILQKDLFSLKLRNFYMVLLQRIQHAGKKKRGKKRNFLDILQTLTHSFRHKVYFYVSPANYRANDSNFVLLFLFFLISFQRKPVVFVYFLCIRTEKYASLLNDCKNNKKVTTFYRKQLSVLLKYQSVSRTHTSIFQTPFISEAIVSL